VILASISFFVIQTETETLWDDLSSIVAIGLALFSASSLGLLVVVQAKNFCTGLTTSERISKTVINNRKSQLERHTRMLILEEYEFDAETFDFKKDRRKMHTSSILDDSFVEDALGEDDFHRFTKQTKAGASCCTRCCHVLTNTSVPSQKELYE